MAKKSQVSDGQKPSDFLSKLAAIEKDFKDLIVSREEQKGYEVVSFGSLKMDIESGIGGAAYGKLYEIIGWESSGKSTICSNLIANVQRQGKRALLVDSEHSFDDKYAKALGVSLDKEQFKIIQPDYAEQAFEYVKKTAGLFDIVIFDSQTALQTKKEYEGDVGDSAMGLKARLMSTEVRRIMHLAGKHNILVVFVSQLREKIGVMFGSPETTSGGNALKFYCHGRIDVRKTAKADDGLNKTRFKFIKNKLANPFGSGEFDVLWGKGVDQLGELVDLAVEKEIIDKSGSWFSYKETKIGQGSASVRQLLEDNEELRLEIKAAVYSSIVSEDLGTPIQENINVWEHPSPTLEQVEIFARDKEEPVETMKEEKDDLSDLPFELD